MQNYTKPSKRLVWEGITPNVLIIIGYALYAMVQNIQFSIDGISAVVILIPLILYGLYYTFIKQIINQDLFLKFSLLSLFIGLGYQLLTAHVNTPYPILSYLIVFAKMFMPVVMLIVLIKKNNTAELSMVFWIITIIFVYVLITTIIEFAKNENIVHEMSNMNYENFLEDVKNVASMDQSYAVLPVFILCVYALQKCENLFIKIFSVLGLVLIVSFIFVAQFTSILFIMMISLMVEIIWMNKDKQSVVILLGLILLLILALPSILNVIANSIESENMRVRLLEVVAFLSEGDLSGRNMSGRLSMYQKGIIAFFKSPLWGNYILESNPHSSFIQFAADLGIFGLLSYIYMLNRSKKRIGIHLTKDGGKAFGVVFLTLIITGLINPIIQFPTFSIMTFLYVPLGILLIDKSLKDKNKERTYESLEY